MLLKSRGRLPGGARGETLRNYRPKARNYP